MMTLGRWPLPQTSQNTGCSLHAGTIPGALHSCSSSPSQVSSRRYYHCQTTNGAGAGSQQCRDHCAFSHNVTARHRVRFQFGSMSKYIPSLSFLRVCVFTNVKTELLMADTWKFRSLVFRVCRKAFYTVICQAQNDCIMREECCNLYPFLLLVNESYSVPSWD